MNAHAPLGSAVTACTFDFSKPFRKIMNPLPNEKDGHFLRSKLTDDE